MSAGVGANRPAAVNGGDKIITRTEEERRALVDAMVNAYHDANEARLASSIGAVGVTSEALQDTEPSVAPERVTQK